MVKITLHFEMSTTIMIIIHFEKVDYNYDYSNNYFLSVFIPIFMCSFYTVQHCASDIM